jgi:hypothetical protein
MTYSFDDTCPSAPGEPIIPLEPECGLNQRSKRLSMSDVPAPTASRDHGMDRFLCACAVLFVLLLGAASARSQTPPAQTPAPGTKMDDAVRELSSDPRLKNMPQPQQRDLIEFVTGNMLFVGFHELGHAVIQELGLPVLGRQEDAADSFATLALLKLGTNFFLERAGPGGAGLVPDGAPRSQGRRRAPVL